MKKTVIIVFVFVLFTIFGVGNGMASGTTFFGFPVVSLILNGKQAELQNPPVIIDGNTYVPLRFVSESLGASVEWDNTKRVVTINNNSTSDNLKSKIGFDLTSIKPELYSSQGFYRVDGWMGSSFRIAGKEYKKGIGFNLDGKGIDGYVVYKTNAYFRTLTGYFGSDDIENRAGHWNQLIIYGDEKKIYESPKISSGDDPILVDVDITGMNQIKIYFNSPNGQYPVFANPKLY